MFAIFHHFTEWSWNNLPSRLVNAEHLTLDTEIISSAIANTTPVECDEDIVSEHQMTSETESIPVPKSTEKVIYGLQKKIEDVLGKCRTATFLLNDISVLEDVLAKSKVVLETLLSSATTQCSKDPPSFNAIAKVGVQEFHQS